MPKKRTTARSRPKAKPTEADIHAAQELVYSAGESFGTDECELFLSRALVLDPHCTDAHLMLLDRWDAPIEARVSQLEQVTRNAAARLGPVRFAEDAGHFWGLLETRPYMRARFQLAQALAASEQESRAVEEYQGLLQLCPGDNLGARYALVGLLLTLDRVDEAAALLSQYADDASATLVWARVLQQFVVHGADAAGLPLRLARAINQHVEPYLAARRQLPLEVPVSWAVGGAEEAMMVAHDLGEAWRRHPEAVVWLRGAGNRAATFL